MTVDMTTTQSSYWSRQKDEIERITRMGGYCITCGWNSGGIGQKHGFEIVEILLVAHGSWHNDTIVTVERKNKPCAKQISMFEIDGTRTPPNQTPTINAIRYEQTYSDVKLSIHGLFH